jgi:hypothetical protein
MAIKTTLNGDQFAAAMRAVRPDHFTGDALRILFDYFEGLSEDIGEDVECDPIAICCDYSEMSEADFKSAYSNYDELADADSEQIADFISYHTRFCGTYYDVETGQQVFIFAQFN